MSVGRLLPLLFLISQPACIGAVQAQATESTSKAPDRPPQPSKLPNQASPCEPPDIATGEVLPSNHDPCKGDPTEPGEQRRLEPPDIHPIQ